MLELACSGKIISSSYVSWPCICFSQPTCQALEWGANYRDAILALREDPPKKKKKIKIANIYLQYEGVEILQGPLRVSREKHQPGGNWTKINCNPFSRHKLLPKK